MKRNKKALLVLSTLSLAALGLAGCGELDDSIESAIVENGINVTATNTTIALASVDTFDATTLFKIKVNDVDVNVSADMITGSLEKKAGSYTFSLSYNGKTYTSNVNVVDLTPEVITKKINVSSTNLTVEVKNFNKDNVKSLFKITSDGENVEVTDEMLDLGSLEAKVGEYNVTLTYEGITATSKINIIENTKDLSIVAHNQTIELGEALNFDAENLFTITEAGQNVAVRSSMIDETEFNREAVGEYEVNLTYSGTTVTAKLIVVENKKIAISVNSDKLIVTKNDESFNVLDAFSVYAGDKKLEITEDMISGNVDIIAVQENMRLILPMIIMVMLLLQLPM